MLKKAVVYTGAGLVGLGALFFVANRPISEFFSYVRAGASTTVKSIENEIPEVPPRSASHGVRGTFVTEGDRLHGRVAHWSPVFVRAVVDPDLQYGGQ